MITLKLSTGETVTVSDGVVSVPENAVFAELLNAPSMQPPENGHYAPTEDARLAQHILNVWGGTWVSPTPDYPRKLY